MMEIKKISESDCKDKEDDLKEEKEEMHGEREDQRRESNDGSYHIVNTPREKYFQEKENLRLEKDESFTVVDLINSKSRHFDPSYLEDDILKSFDNIDYGEKDLNLKMKKYYIKRLSILKDLPLIDNALISEGTIKENEDMAKLKERFKRSSFEESRRSDGGSQEVLITRTSIQENRSFEISPSRNGQTTTIYEKDKIEYEKPIRNRVERIITNEVIKHLDDTRKNIAPVYKVTLETNANKSSNSKENKGGTINKDVITETIVEKCFDILSSSHSINLMSPAGTSKTYEKEKILNAIEDKDVSMNIITKVSDSKAKQVIDESFDILTLKNDILPEKENANNERGIIMKVDSKVNLKLISLETSKDPSEEQADESFDILAEPETIESTETENVTDTDKNNILISLETVVGISNQHLDGILTSSLKLESSFDDITDKEQPRKMTNSKEKLIKLEIKTDAEKQPVDESFHILASPQKPISPNSEKSQDREGVENKEEEFIIVSPKLVNRKKIADKESTKNPKVLSWSDLKIIEDDSPFHIENPNNYISRRDMKKMLDEYDEENNKKTELLVREMREANESIVKHFEEIIANTCKEIKGSIKERQDSQLNLINNVILLQNQVIHDNIEIKEMFQHCTCAKSRKHVTFSGDVDGHFVDSFESDGSSKESKLNQKVKQLFSRVIPKSNQSAVTDYLRQNERIKEQFLKEQQSINMKTAENRPCNEVVCIVEKSKLTRVDVMEDITEVPELEVSSTDSDDAKQTHNQGNAECVKVIPYYERMKRRVADDNGDYNIWEQANARQIENKDDNSYFIDLLDKNKDEDSLSFSILDNTLDSVDMIKDIEDAEDNIQNNDKKNIKKRFSNTKLKIEGRLNDVTTGSQEYISNNITDAHKVATKLTNMVEENIRDLGKASVKTSSKIESGTAKKIEEGNEAVKNVTESKNTYPQKERKTSRRNKSQEEHPKLNKGEDKIKVIVQKDSSK